MTPAGETIELEQRLARLERAVFGRLPRDPQHGKLAQRIIRRIADDCGMSAAGLTGQCRRRRIVEARWIAMRILRVRFRASLSEVGAWLGGRDHGTVFNGLKRLQEIMDLEPEFRERVERLERELGAEEETEA